MGENRMYQGLAIFKETSALCYCMWLYVFRLIQGVAFTTQDSERVSMFDFPHGFLHILTCSGIDTCYLEFIDNSLTSIMCL